MKNMIPIAPEKLVYPYVVPNGKALMVNPSTGSIWLRSHPTLSGNPNLIYFHEGYCYESKEALYKVATETIQGYLEDSRIYA